MAKGSGKSRSRGAGRTRVGLVVLVSSLAILSVFFYLSYSASNTRGLAIDWRLRLTIHDAGTPGINYTIPALIGVQGGIWANHTLDKYGPPGYAPLSTRDGSGIVYVQATRCDLTFCPIFTFGDFFNIWGVQFDKNCVPDGRGGVYCGGPGFPDPPPFLSDGANERCVDRSIKLANGKDWIIFIGASAASLFCG